MLFYLVPGGFSYLTNELEKLENCFSFLTQKSFYLENALNWAKLFFPRPLLLFNYFSTFSIVDYYSIFTAILGQFWMFQDQNERFWVQDMRLQIPGSSFK